MSWTNGETWNAWLWMTNEQGWYEYILETLPQIEEKEDQVEFLKNEWSVFVINQIENVKDEEDKIAVLQQYWDSANINFEEIVDRFLKVIEENKKYNN